MYPENVEGKFQSRYVLKMFQTFFQAYSVVVLLHLVDVVILSNFGYLNLSNIGAAVFCGVQLCSILENLSSANGAKWAKILQRFMVDKAKRHFNIHIDKDIWGVADDKKENSNLTAFLLRNNTGSWYCALMKSSKKRFMKCCLKWV
jgi:hypothetical protein